MDNTISGNIISLNDVSHRKITGYGHLARERRHRQLLPRPGDQRGGARWEVGGHDVALRHVPQQGQLQLLRLGQQGLEYILDI